MEFKKSDAKVVQYHSAPLSEEEIVLETLKLIREILGHKLICGNTWNRLHGFPMTHTKRYKHQRKDLPKNIRVQLSARRKAGCSQEFINQWLKREGWYR